MLVEHGAIWKPDGPLTYARRSLYGVDPEVTVEVVGLLRGKGACDEATLHDLLERPACAST